MSVIKVNNITSRDGTTGPVIAGIATVSTTSHMVVPTGRNGKRYVDGGENIVRDGLVLHLDVKYSYDSSVGIGTTTVGAAATTGSSSDGDLYTWYDMSGYENNGGFNARGTTTPTIGLSTENGGSLLFNGVNSYIDCGNDLSLQLNTGTVSVWFRADTSNSGFNGIVAKQNAWGLFVYDNKLIAYDWGPASGIRDTGVTVGNNTWNHATLTFSNIVGAGTSTVNNAKIYRNGVGILTTTIGLLNHTVTLQIGEANAGQYFGGRISQVAIYNRELSAAEVSQNFNALKSRFGL